LIFDEILLVTHADENSTNRRQKGLIVMSLASVLLFLQWQAARKTKLSSEINWKTSDTAGEPYRLAWNAGFEQKLRDGLFLHDAVGNSLRGHNRGGPDLRVYLGLEYDFDSATKNDSCQSFKRHYTK
jgi:hypothetical protein